MKNVIRTVALVGTFGLMSGMAFADHHEDMKDHDLNEAETSVDSANDPDDGQTEPNATMSDDAVVEEENVTDSANDPEDAMNDPDGQLEEGEVASDNGVDSANDPED
ncbi:hypothetical protein LPL18_004700 [Halomonas sp. CUBES01]|uniref:Uncharacterized protein n=1 Tax=Vreelandella gomseomensis TaxID=370766 RepID=A0ABU1GEL9_9GAMM|nr:MULTISPECIES: hypothetical protein [Halomonas]MDR5875936.1 hypothetical protein [Halomonas gomseomensis]MEC4766637.1 hypothetical protein [Halomonas sp. CUBES01]